MLMKALWEPMGRGWVLRGTIMWVAVAVGS